VPTWTKDVLVWNSKGFGKALGKFVVICSVFAYPKLIAPAPEVVESLPELGPSIDRPINQQLLVRLDSVLVIAI
jgi:hypothetical protein